MCSFSSVHFFCSVMSNSLWPPWPAARQTYLCITNSQSLLKLMYIELVMPFNHLILCRPLFLLPKFFSASGSFSISQFFASGGQSIGALALASVLPMNIQDWFHLVWSPCSPRDSLEPSPTPQFKRINFLALSFLYSPTLTSIHN